MKRLKFLLVFVLIPSLLIAQGLPIKNGTTSQLAKVDANGNLLMTFGPSVRETYYVTATGLVTTAAYNISIEASAATGFKLINWCVAVSNATAAALVTVNINRRSTASSGGVVAASEATTSPSISKADPAAGNFAGVVRQTATLGTIGALLDGVGFQVGTIAGGNALQPFCRSYTGEGAKALYVAAGTANGISITVTAPGAGGLASGSISAVIIQE